MSELKQDTNKVISDVIEIVTNNTGIDHADMISKKRKREIVGARQCAIWLIRKYAPSVTLSQLGKIFGDRHHSTIIHAIEVVEDQIFCNNKDFTWVRKVVTNKADDIALDADPIVNELSKAARALKLGYVVESHARIERAIEMRRQMLAESETLTNE